MNIETIFSAITGVIGQTGPDAAQDQDSDFTGFVWEGLANAGSADGRLPADARLSEQTQNRPEADANLRATQDSRPDMPRISAGQAFLAPENGPVEQLAPAIRPSPLTTGLPDSATPGSAPVSAPPSAQASATTLEAKPAATVSGDHPPAQAKTTDQTRQTVGRPAEVQGAAVPDVDLVKPEHSTQMQMTRPSVAPRPHPPEPQVFLSPPRVRTPAKTAAVEATEIQSDAGASAAHPTPPQQVQTPVPSPHIGTQPEAGISSRVVAKEAHAPHPPTPSAAPVTAPSSPTPLAPETDQAAPIPIPPAAETTDPPSSHQVSPSPIATEQRPPAPIRETAHIPGERVHAPAQPPGISTTHAPAQPETHAPNHPAHPTMPEHAADAATGSAPRAATTAHPAAHQATHPAVHPDTHPATLATKTSSSGKSPVGVLQSEAGFIRTEQSPSHPPHLVRSVQHRPSNAAQPLAHSTPPLAPGTVMPGDVATIAAPDAGPMAELAFSELAVTPTSVTGPNPPLAQPLINHAPRVIQVIAEAARALQDRPVEVTLNPEELGRVRLTLHSVEGSMSVSVAVERPETLDLLRRNIEMLASQLRELGYKNLSFSFAGQGDNFGSDQDQRDDTQNPGADDPVSAVPAPQPDRARIIVGYAGGVDIRA